MFASTHEDVRLMTLASEPDTTHEFHHAKVFVHHFQDKILNMLRSFTMCDLPSRCNRRSSFMLLKHRCHSCHLKNELVYLFFLVVQEGGTEQNGRHMHAITHRCTVLGEHAAVGAYNCTACCANT